MACGNDSRGVSKDSAVEVSRDDTQADRFLAAGDVEAPFVPDLAASDTSPIHDLLAPRDACSGGMYSSGRECVSFTVCLPGSHVAQAGTTTADQICDLCPSGSFTTVANSASCTPMPNVLILLTDDQRYDTVHALGNPLIQTPNIDRLVHAGTSFSQASDQGGIASAVCITSRASLMTGRTINHLAAEYRDGEIIPVEQTTLPELLRQAGYVTFATGKWHSDVASYVRIFDRAANIFFGGMHLPEDGGHEHPLLYNFDPTGSYPPETQFQGDRFASTMFADAAVDFIKTLPMEGRPFFGYVAFTSPHDPRTPPPPFDTMYAPGQTPLPDNFLSQHPFDNGELHNHDEDLMPTPRDPDLVRQQIAAYYGMISAVDAEIGRILDTLEDRNLLDNTIIIFASDNGLALGSHGLLGKQNLYDHSIRVPLILAGPGIAANSIDNQLVYLSDLLPTVAALLGLAPPTSSDGNALLGTNAAPPRQSAYYQYHDWQRAIRTADHWKLIGYRLTATGLDFDRMQLFNLSVDPSETNDLSTIDEYQVKLGELRSLLVDERARYDDPPTPWTF
jgi:arylsulfatase A-like enzyme